MMTMDTGLEEGDFERGSRGGGHLQVKRVVYDGMGRKESLRSLEDALSLSFCSEEDGKGKW